MHALALHCFLRGDAEEYVYLPDITNGFLVALERLQIVHVALPVLDAAAVVARHQPVLVVAPHHGTNGRVVRLQNGLEVEHQAVPECELAARCARDQTSTLGSPLGKNKTKVTQ